MLHMKLLRSTMAHAEIVSIDTTQAAALPGVKGILTGKDMLQFLEEDDKLNASLMNEAGFVAK